MRLKVEKVDLSGVDKKLQRIGKRDDVGTFMAMTVYRAYQEYVPREEGDLEDSCRLGFLSGHGERSAQAEA